MNPICQLDHYHATTPRHWSEKPGLALWWGLILTVLGALVTGVEHPHFKVGLRADVGMMFAAGGILLAWSFWNGLRYQSRRAAEYAAYLNTVDRDALVAALVSGFLEPDSKRMVLQVCGPRTSDKLTHTQVHQFWWGRWCGT